MQGNDEILTMGDTNQTLQQLQEELSQLHQQRAWEQAAERIRFKVLSMRSQDDLLNVAVMMFHELGMESPACVFFSSMKPNRPLRAMSPSRIWANWASRGHRLRCGILTKIPP